MNHLDRFLTRVLMVFGGVYALTRAFVHHDIYLGAFSVLLLFVGTIGAGLIPREEDRHWAGGPEPDGKPRGFFNASPAEDSGD